MARLMKFIINKIATCSDCGLEWDTHDCEAKAKKHSANTGHITNLNIDYLIAPPSKADQP